MSVHRIASRYAKSIIDLAQERNELERVKEDVDALNSAISNRDFYLLLKSPIVNSDKKESIIKAIFDGKLSEMMMAFINLLVQKGRESHLPAIVGAFDHQYRRLKNITVLKVITAKKLDDEGINTIVEKFKASNQTDQNIEVETEVDPSLIGGFVVKFGDKLYDASVKHQLDSMKKEFRGNVYKSQIVSR